MDRIIKFSELQEHVQHVYERFKDDPRGNLDSRISGSDPSEFGIAVVLTDGRTIKYGQTDKQVALTGMAKTVAAEVLANQLNKPHDLARKIKGGSCISGGAKVHKPKVPTSPLGIRLVSAIEPTGDSDGKWDLMIDSLINLTNGTPTLDVELYKALTAENQEANTENTIAEAGYVLYDDAPIAIDLYTKLKAIKVSASELATMAATIAADGYNPLTKENVFDGANAASIVSFMAVHGPHHMSLPWLVRTGLPAQSSYAGSMFGVVPGVFGIAAYSPLVNDGGVSSRSAHAFAHLMKELGISALGSERVRID